MPCNSGINNWGNIPSCAKWPYVQGIYPLGPTDWQASKGIKPVPFNIFNFVVSKPPVVAYPCATPDSKTNITVELNFGRIDFQNNSRFRYLGAGVNFRFRFSNSNNSPNWVKSVLPVLIVLFNIRHNEVRLERDSRYFHCSIFRIYSHWL